MSLSPSWSSSIEGRDVSDDVLFEIFLLLPTDSLIRFRFVCKYWFNLITSYIRDPRFVHMHTYHHPPSNATTTSTTDNLPTMFYTSTKPFQSHNLYSLNNINASSSLSSKYNAEAIEIVYPFKTSSSHLEILGSCNGVLCIKVVDYHGANHAIWGRIDYTEGILCLWNPCTNEFKLVPAEPIDNPGYDIGIVKVTYGFGYDRLINDYKLVRLVRFSPSYNKVYFNRAEIRVYTLGTNSWKRVDKKIPYCLVECYSTRVDLYLNGALHWISRQYNRIYSFNIEDEEFLEVPKPAEGSKKVMRGAKLQVLRGCLCMFSSYNDRSIGRVFEVWMMMDYGVQESWTKLFTISTPVTTQSRNLKPLWICKNGEVLIGNGETNLILVLYDPKNSRFESVGYQGIPLSSKINTIVHIGSLVSLKSGTYVDQEQQRPKDEEEGILNGKGEKYL